MNISMRHISATVFIAMLLHIAVAGWISMPVNTPELTEKKTMKINLLAQITEETVNAAPKIIKPPIKEKKQKKIKKKIVKKTNPVKKPQIKPEPPEEENIETEAVEKIIQAEPIQNTKPMDAIASARYEQLLVAWLEKHKKYPRRAKRLRIEGEAQLRIIIDRSGHTQQVSLAQRTGNRLLDKAALDMVQRANPFPAMPKNDPRQRLEFIVPVAFLLN